MRRKILLVVGLILLVQLVWVPSTFAAPPAPGYGPGGGGGERGGGLWHRVSWGESLSSIGWAYGVSPYAICAANGLANCDYVWAGQRLRIPGGRDGRDGRDGGAGCAAYQTVAWGQTLSGIAAWYGMSSWRVARANGISNPNQVYAGQTLCIPGW